MKRFRIIALVAAALLASISYWPEWPTVLWVWLAALSQLVASLSYDPNWPAVLLLWFFCPDPNWLGGGCGNYTNQMVLVRVLAGGGPILVAGIAFVLHKRNSAQKGGA
jgi:hypothetical protein